MSNSTTDKYIFIRIWFGSSLQILISHNELVRRDERGEIINNKNNHNNNNNNINNANIVHTDVHLLHNPFTGKN